MRTTTLLTAFFLFAVLSTAAAQNPSSSTKPLTPAEQKRKEKLEKEIQEQRRFKAEMAERQRQYFAEQAEKERRKKEKEAEREARKRSPAAPTTGTAPEVTPVRSEPAGTRAPAAEPTGPETRSPARPSLGDRVREARRAAAGRRQAEKESEKASSSPSPAPEAARERGPARRPVRSVPVAAPARPDTTTAFSPRKELLPRNHLFEPILLDPLQAQTYGSVLPVFVSEGNRYKGSIVPFAFGLQKPFLRRQTGTDRASEWALDVASFTQFEVYQDEKIHKQRRQLVNTDYRVGISYHLRRGPGTWRFRAYHLSSHLGDDYIIRNQLNYRLPNAVNYELVDATYSRQLRDYRVYGGAGIGLRSARERKPMSVQGGFWYHRPGAQAIQFVGGMDMKLWQQTNFRPGVKAGAGFTTGRGPGNLTLLLETYSGFRPYSIYENDRVFWLGFGLYLQPF